MASRRRGRGPALVGFETRVTGDREVAALFEDVHSRVRARAREVVGRLAFRVADHGASVVYRMVKEGRSRLGRGFVYSEKETAQSVSALVFHRSRHFYILSAGSPKNETVVDQHSRHVKSRDRVGVRSSRLSKKGNRTLIRWGVTAMGYTSVRQHRRKVNLRSRPFLATTWRELGGAGWATAEIEKAAHLGAKEARAGITGTSDEGEGI